MGPPVAIAVVLALVQRFLEVRLGLGVVLAFAAALLAFLFVRIRVLLSEPALDRAIGHGWARLVAAAALRRFFAGRFGIPGGVRAGQHRPRPAAARASTSWVR